MARFFDYVGIVLAAIIGLEIIAFMMANLTPSGLYKLLIQSTVKSATGRELVIDGDLEISLYTALAFKASG